MKNEEFATALRLKNFLNEELRIKNEDVLMSECE